jgi:type III secretory pathway component EscS
MRLGNTHGNQTTPFALQISTSLSVAIIGGIFYTLLGTNTDAAAITHAFTVSILCIAACLAVGAGLSLSLARQPAAELQTAAMHPAE